MKLPAQYFRAGVGAVIINENGYVLALERSDIPGAWQFPQGGLEAGEALSAAIFREIKEETGIAQHDLQLVEVCPELLAYELPPEARSKKTGRGQVQYWFLFTFNGKDDAIKLTGSDEFSAWRWLPAHKLLQEVVEFRVPVYRRLVELFSNHLAN